MASNKKDIYWRAYLIYFGFVIAMLVVLFKTISIQFEGGTPYFINATDGNKKIPTRIVERQPRKGQILDINYRPLVTSVSFYDIHMDPTVAKDAVFTKDLHSLCVELYALYPTKSVDEWKSMIRTGRSKKRRYLLIKKKATNEERKKLRQMPILKLGRLGGGIIDNEEIIIRKRPHGELMKRTLGYVKEVDGKVRKVGIEGAYDEYLKGEPGEVVEQRISTGWKKTGQMLKDPIEGASVVTTIDKSIQEVAHNELMNQLVSQDAQSGCVIVMEVKTGYVKAIVNLRKDRNGNYSELYNKAIGTKEVPGSTFKLASLMALLEDDKVKLSDKVNAKGVYRFYDLTLRDSHHEGYGTITVQEAFEKSSNVFSEIVNTAYKSEPQRYINRLKSFGLADTLGISLSGEPKPTMYEPGMSSWHGATLPWMAIGYEFQQTPLQTLTFYNAVANNGAMVKPQFVKEIIRKGEVIKQFEPIVMIDRICSESTLNDLHTCLEGVVKRGTGTALKSAYFDIAGKTGTARVLGVDNNYNDADKKYQASFCGYFPAEDPIYSCIVVVAAPSKNIYGSVVSGTVFTAIANRVYATSLKYHKPVNDNGTKSKQIPISKDGNLTDLKEIYKVLNIPYEAVASTEWVNTHSGGEKLLFTKRFVGVKTVPNVKGMTAKDAVFLMEKTGLKVKISGYGKVVNQSILPGQEVIVGKLIELRLK